MDKLLFVDTTHKSLYATVLPYEDAYPCLYVCA